MRKKNWFSTIWSDPWLMLVSIILTMIGVAMIYSTTHVMAVEEQHNAYVYLKKHAVSLALGFAGLLFFSQLPMKTLRQLAPWILLGVFGFLTLVLLPGFGVRAGGAIRWLKIAGIRVGQPPEPNKRLLYSLAAFAIGMILPHMLLRSRIDRRKQAIIKKFPDALDLMTICVDAGLTFDGAMAQVAGKWDDPLSQEFARVVNELQLGKSRRQALRDMSDRADVPDVSSFVASILQADQLGVSIGKVLRIQSEQMRIRRRQRAEELAHQAPVKMTIPLVFLIFPSILLVLLGPAIFQVIRSDALRGLIG